VQNIWCRMCSFDCHLSFGYGRTRYRKKSKSSNPPPKTLLNLRHATELDFRSMGKVLKVETSVQAPKRHKPTFMEINESHGNRRLGLACEYGWWYDENLRTEKKKCVGVETAQRGKRKGQSKTMQRRKTPSTIPAN
jgi:hypothetical protein